jgi:3-oxoacyl-(acyl-carrier-protein) synthase
MPEKRRVAITGVGVCTPLADDYLSFGAKLGAGGHSFAQPVRYSTKELRGSLASSFRSLPDSAIDPKTRHLHSDLSLVTKSAAKAAWDMRRVIVEDNVRGGVIFGSGMINLYDLEATYRDVYDINGGGLTKIPPLTIPVHMSSAPASILSMDYALQGRVKTVSAACASGLIAVGEAYELIGNGEQDLMLTGGADILCCETIHHAWDRLRILSQSDDGSELVKPFDRSRKGLALGDGAAMLVLEDFDQAASRSAEILGEVIGYAQTADAADMVKPGEGGMTRAMQMALDKAGLRPTDISIIICHGTGTALNDTVEAKALLNTFGTALKDIPVTSNKGQIGHTMGASGVLSLAQALYCFGNDEIHPIPNHQMCDEAVDLKILKQKLSGIKSKYALINSFAFGGINASMIIAKV